MLAPQGSALAPSKREVVRKQRQLREAEAARLGMPAGAVSSGRNLEAERAELASLKSQQLEAQRQMQARSRPRTHAIPPRTHPDQCIPSRPHSTR